jgi:hypothetical protein
MIRFFIILLSFFSLLDACQRQKEQIIDDRVLSQEQVLTAFSIDKSLDGVYAVNGMPAVIPERISALDTFVDVEIEDPSMVTLNLSAPQESQDTKKIKAERFKEALKERSACSGREYEFIVASDIYLTYDCQKNCSAIRNKDIGHENVVKSNEVSLPAPICEVLWGSGARVNLIKLPDLND